jgi:RND family efflux transporter MFP subunit
MPAKEEKLSFSIGGVLIDTVYANEGQMVKKGDLLVKLEQENLIEQIAEQKYKLKVLELEKEHAAKQMELDLILLQLEAEKSGEKDAELVSSYADQIQDLEDSIYIENLRLQDLEKALALREIRAGISGTVTKVSKVKEGDRSVKGNVIVTVSDMDTTVFVVQGNDASYFTEGDQVTIQCQRKEYEAYVVNPKEMGIEDKEGDGKVAYLKMKYPDPTLEEKSRGTVYIVLDQRTNALYVSNKAIKTSNGEEFVYMLDEEGMRVMRPVTTGMESDGYIEIVSGLAEGEAVIIE